MITAIMGDYDDIPPVPEGFEHALLVSDVPIKSRLDKLCIGNTVTFPLSEQNS